MLRITFLLAVLSVCTLTVSVAQDKKPSSPKETVKGKIGDTNIEIVYSAPSSRGRNMIGGNEKYGQVWRTGANEDTTIEFDKAVKIEGKDLAAGKYALFTIPNENEWTIIFNKEAKQWGAYNYKESDDALRVKVKANKPASFVEKLTISVEKDEVAIKWENSSVAFKVKG